MKRAITYLIATLIVLSPAILSSSAFAKKVLRAPGIVFNPPIIAAPVRQHRGSDPLSEKQWAMRRIGMPAVWNYYEGSRAVKVMIVGTGINYNHPDLRANVWVNHLKIDEFDPETGHPISGKNNNGNHVNDYVGYDFVDEVGLPFDHYGSDTHAAGIIAATHKNDIGIKGMMNYVSIYPVRYINTNGMSSVPLLIQALQLVDQVRPHVILLNLVNMRLATNGTVQNAEATMIRQALDKIQALGIPIVAGSGNLPTQISTGADDGVIQIIRRYPNVFIVSSVDDNDKLALIARVDKTWVHTMAPGKDVLTTAPFGGWEKASGTMVAAAHVAGAIALAYSMTDFSYRQMFEVLLSEEGSDYMGEDFEEYCAGKNRLNVQKFLSALTGAPIEPIE